MKKELILNLLFVGIGISGIMVGSHEIGEVKKEMAEIQSAYEEQVAENENVKNQLEQEQNESEELLKEIEKLQAGIIKREETIKSKDEAIKAKDAELEALKKNEINVELTGYCNCSYCTQSGAGVTASGTTTRIGTIATPKEIPLGTKLEIPYLTYYKNDATFEALDRGGAIKTKSDGTYIIDVWFPTHQQALDFGRVKTKAYIL